MGSRWKTYSYKDTSKSYLFHMEAFCPEIVDERPSKRVRTETLAYHEIMPWQQFEIESFGETSVVLNLEENTKTPIPKDEKVDSEDDSEDDDDEDQKIFVSVPEISCATFQERHVKKTLEQCLEEMKAPQRSDTWLSARKFSITASQFGAAAGHSPQTTPKTVAIEKIWSTFVGNAATMQGTLHEPNASLTFEKFFGKFESSQESFEMREYGLLKHPKCPWIAVSPDGILYVTRDNKTEWQVLEYKCPQYRNQGYEHPQKKWDHNVPVQYLDQVQGILGYLHETQVHAIYDDAVGRSKFPNLQERPSGAFFVVWTPNQSYATFVPYMQPYFQNELLPALKQFQFQILLPAMTHFENGKLQSNSLDARETIQV